MRRQGIRGIRASIGLGMVAALAAATPVTAYVQEGGSKNCGAFIGYVHGVYYDVAWLKGPGGTEKYYGDNDNQWHTQERNGSYTGSWHARGEPDLDTGLTFAGCRNFG